MGVHLDAPYHYHPTMGKGKPAQTADEIPLDWYYGDGAVPDFLDKPAGIKSAVKDFGEALFRIDYELKEKNIVLIRTGADQYWGTPKYLISGCGVDREVTLWLLEQRVRVVGTDVWSRGRPLLYITREFDEAGDSSIIREGHFTGIEKRYCHIERLTSSGKLSATGFKLGCYPVKIKKTNAGWIRAMTMIEEEKKE